LRELGRKAVVLDPLGNGRSDCPADAAEYALPALVPRLFAVLDALAVKKADLIGLSMGGVWAQHALRKEHAEGTAQPRFRNIALIGSCLHISARMRSILLGLRALFQHDLPPLQRWRILQALLFSAEFLEQPSTVPLLEALSGAAQGSGSSAVCQLDALLAHDGDPSSIKTRGICCVLGGELDILTPPATQREVAAAFSGVPVRILSGAGHAVWIEQPRALAGALASALPR
jgi:pimeloyl-ACP methyl ester carboxylesterase